MSYYRKGIIIIAFLTSHSRFNICGYSKKQQQKKKTYDKNIMYDSEYLLLVLGKNITFKGTAFRLMKLWFL